MLDLAYFQVFTKLITKTFPNPKNKENINSLFKPQYLKVLNKIWSFQDKKMSQSILSSSIRQASNIQLERKQSQLMPLYTGNKINPYLKSIVQSIKNSFGVVTCIGSEQFYVFTRQMLLHLDFSKASTLTEEAFNDLDDYKSQQFERDNFGVDVNSPKKIRKRPFHDDMETSFAKGNSDEIKNILEAEIYQIESDYQLSHNQLIQKDPETLQFKKASSSIVHDVSPSFKTQSRESLLMKNKEIDLIDPLSHNHQLYDRPSPIEKNKSVKFIDESFHQDVENFKQSMQKKKIQELMRKKGCIKINRNGEQKYAPKNDFLRLYNSKEIGTDKQKRPIEWIYCQTKDLTSQAIEASYMLSSTIVYELPFSKQPSVEQFEKELKEYLQFYRRIQMEFNKYDESNSDMPDVVIVCPVEDSQNTQTVKANLKSVFHQLEAFIIPDNSKKNLNYFQSPFSQFHKSNSPSKSKLPPTPKRMPVSHRNSQNPSTGPKRKVRLEFRVISEELSRSGVLRENYSRMRQITTQGREIFNQQLTKSLCGNWVSSGCYITLLERISDIAPNLEIQEFYETWESVFEDFIKSTMDDAAQKYEEKVNELIVGKAIISQSRLTQIHEVAKKQTLRQFSQKKIGSSRVFIESSKQIKSNSRLPSCENISNSRRISINRKLVESRKQLFFGDQDSQQPQFSQEELINLVESRLEQQKQQLSSKTKGQAIKWCRKFLSSEYEQIKKKLLSNEIKSIVNFRQQLDFLKQSYKKKLQNHSALEYEMMEEFTNFMVENLFAGIQVLNEKERQEWKEKIKKENKKAEDLQLQIKELKRSLLLKQRALSQQKAQLQNKLQELQSSIQNLSSELEVKSKQINYLKAQHEQHLQQKQAQNLKKIESIKREFEEVKKQNDSKASDIIYLQSELEKQQLLHQQTHQNYQQILLTYKNNVTQLEKKVKELKESNSIAQEKAKNLLLKEQIDQEFSKYKQESVLKIETLSKALEEKTKLLDQHHSQMTHKLQEASETIKELLTQKSEIQLQFKLIEEKLIEMESRLPRYKSNESQLEKNQKEIQQLTEQIQSLSNEKAIVQQKLTFSVKESQKTIQKLNQNLSKQTTALKQEISDLKLKNQSYHKKLNEDKFTTEVQTIFTVDRSQQITIKSRCKNCKQNQSKLIEAMKIAQVLNENYQNLKNKFYH